MNKNLKNCYVSSNNKRVIRRIKVTNTLVEYSGVDLETILIIIKKNKVLKN